MNRLITFEGIDGSGKSTQIKKICSKFDSMSISYISVREPGGTRISEKIRAILLDREHLELSKISEPLLFLAARSQLVSQQILPALAGGKFVLCDRYTDSTLAYQGFGRDLPVDQLRVLNDFATQNTTPELTFLLDINFENSQARRSIKEDDRMEAGGNTLLSKVKAGYLEIALIEPTRVKVIDGKLSESEIFQQIWKILQTTYHELKG